MTSPIPKHDPSVARCNCGGTTMHFADCSIFDRPPPPASAPAADDQIQAWTPAAQIPISRELGIEMGVIEPTPAERAELERQAVEAKLAAAERKARRQIARERFAAISHTLARSMLDLHSESADGDCDGCDVDGYESWQPDWPCRTVETIARHYGIELP